MPLADKYVLIAGCRDEERSYEYHPPESGGAVSHGALTYFLCQQLRQAVPGTTYRDVFERAAALVTAANPEQHPQMEGSADREVFGVRDVTPASFVLVEERQGAVALLAAGAAHGVTLGSTFRVYPPGTKEPDGATALGEVEITFVGAVTAEARITQETPEGVIAAGSRAFVSAHGFGDFRLKVQLIDEGSHAEAVAGMRALLQASPRVKLVDADTPADARVYLLSARDEVSPDSPVPQLGFSATPCWAVVSQTGDLLMRAKAVGDESTILANLEGLARYRQMLSVENPDPASALKGRFTLDLLRRGHDGAWAVAPADASTGLVAYEEGELIAFRVTSRHDAPVYVSLLDFGLTGAVSPVFPPRGAQQALAPGESFDIPAPGRGLALGWPAGFPFVDTADRLREAEGTETVRLFVTAHPTDFLAVEQPGMRSGRVRTPLADLLRGAMHGGVARDIVMAPESDDDWTTVSRSFVLRRRTSVALPIDGAPVTIGTATLAAPGLSGTAATGFGVRERAQADRLVTGALHDALNASGIATRQTIEIGGVRERGPAARSVGDQPALELTLPEPEPGYGQMVLAADELGVVSWCFGSSRPARPAGRGSARADASRTYLVPRAVPELSGAEPGARGIVGLLGKKFLKELVFPLVDPVLGEVGAAFVNRLEQARWPYRLRTFTPDDYALDRAGAIDADGWARLTSGRALLLVHGTFSRAHLAFGQLPRDYVETLHRLYGGRVFAFDHFTLSHDPRENVRWLLSQVPDGIDLTLDVVSHSRGGLVSRLLSEKQGEFSLGARRMRIGKVVLVGSPSAGTALADPEHVGAVLDVFTNLMNVIPDNGIVEVLTMIVEVAKQIAVGAFGGLDGLQSMRPGGAFTTWLNAGARTGDTRYFAVASDVTPADPGLRHFAVSRGLNRLLRGANDFVVPTEGVFAANGSGFFPIDDRLVLAGEDAAPHTAYFADARVRDRILEWLAP